MMIAENFVKITRNAKIHKEDRTSLPVRIQFIE